MRQTGVLSKDHTIVPSPTTRTGVSLQHPVCRISQQLLFSCSVGGSARVVCGPRLRCGWLPRLHQEEMASLKASRTDFRPEPPRDRLYERRCHEPVVKHGLPRLVMTKSSGCSRPRPRWVGKYDPGRTMRRTTSSPTWTLMPRVRRAPAKSHWQLRHGDICFGELSYSGVPCALNSTPSRAGTAGVMWVRNGQHALRRRG